MQSRRLSVNGYGHGFFVHGSIGRLFDRYYKTRHAISFEKEEHQGFPRSQPPASAAFDRREPGLFKEEFVGTAMVALCSKTYCVENNENVRTSKFSCKGLNKSNFSHLLTLYKEVLFNQSSAGETNRGFRARGNTVFTYTQHRQGLNSDYPKRKGLADGGIHNLP